MSPILPDFTVHDLVKSKLNVVSENKGKISFEDYGKPIVMKEFTKEELKEKYSPSVLSEEESVAKDESGETEKILLGQDGWLMTPVIKSSNIMEIGFKENKCRVLFKGLKLFEYEPINEELWLQFLAAKSKGEFFSKHIRNNKKIKVKQVL